MKYLNLVIFLGVLSLLGACVPEANKKCSGDQVLVNGLCVPKISNNDLASNLDCEVVLNHQEETRITYQSSSARYPDSCQEEVQKRSCDNGQLLAWSGSFKSVSCTNERIRYAASSVVAGQSCQSEIQKQICQNGECGEWSPNRFSQISCQVQGYLSCGNVPHNGSESRVAYSSSSMAYGQVCVQQNQTRTCNNGSWSAWSGTYANLSCSVQAAAACGTIASGQSESRTRYQASSVITGQTCVSEIQKRLCTNGTFGNWSGTYTNTTCSVQIAASCGNTASGAYEVRTMYQAATVSEENTCVSQIQNRLCTNGQFGSWSGTYTQSKCEVSRVRYESNTVSVGTTCKSQTQLMTCEKAVCGIWSPGDYTYTTCSVQAVSPNQTTEIQMLQSVKRHDITWTFDKKYPVAQYINGDFAVIAQAEGVKILTVSPAPSDGQNGSGVNIKTGTQPADSRATHFAQGISYPITLHSGDSLISFLSIQPSDHNCPPDSYGAVYKNIMNYCDRSFVKGASVLTIVDKAPVLNEFRPTPLGDKENRRNYIFSNIDQVVKNLPKLVVSDANKYDINKLIRSKDRLQYDAVGNWGRRMSAPADNQAGYAAYSNNGDALLGLAVDYPENLKKQLLIAVIQHGIDLEGASRLGFLLTSPDGGHGTHQLSVMAITSALLGNASYTAYVKTVQGAEKGHTYLNAKNVALWGKTCDISNFKAMCIDDNYQKGAKDCRDPDGVYDELNKPNSWTCINYQTLNSPYYPSEALAMGLLGAVDDFNHIAYFKYADRWMLLNGGIKSTFAKEMWQKYRSTISW